jgi:hypothetical protein
MRGDCKCSVGLVRGILRYRAAPPTVRRRLIQWRFVVATGVRQFHGARDERLSEGLTGTQPPDAHRASSRPSHSGGGIARLLRSLPSARNRLRRPHVRWGSCSFMGLLARRTSPNFTNPTQLHEPHPTHRGREWRAPSSVRNPTQANRTKPLKSKAPFERFDQS